MRSVQIDPARPDEENPAVFARSKMAARASGFPFELRGKALAGVESASRRYLDLDRKTPGTRKSTDVVPHDQVTLLVNAAQWGVGGNTQWSEFGKALPQYRTTLAPTRVAFRLTPFPGEGHTPDKARPARATEIE